jgi:Domain of unknown function (DUF4175)
MRIPFGSHEPPADSDLIGIIRQIRRRWRIKLALRGAAMVAALMVAVFLAAALGLESSRFAPGLILTFRVLLPLALLALVGLFFIRPLLRRVSDEQVALYLEEHEPSLQAEIISAVEASRMPGTPSTLVKRLVDSAVEKARALEDGRRVERKPLNAYAGAVSLVVIATLALFWFGPAYLRHALSALVLVSRSVEAAVPYKIEVKPGNVNVPKGADQAITAELLGFSADQPVLMVRKTADGPFERVPLIREDTKFQGMLFDLAGSLDYFVEAGGVRSTTFRLNVVDMPYVQKLELEYHFPAYTGLEPRKIEDGGDIAVLRGTEVRVKIVPTMPTKAGQIAINEQQPAGLTLGADGTLAGKFVVDKDGFYRVELDAPTGERVTASPQYTIDVLTDQPPTVSIAKPGRDSNASPIEEVFIEARAEDDFGIRDLELVYSVNGAAEKSVRLFDGAKRLPEVSAGHTFYLEELDVSPGDFVSYYARAADNDAVQGGKKATSDIYFVQIRPLKKDFRRAESQAGGGGGGGQDNQVGALSQQQRQIISATFNINRDRKKMTAEKLKESSVVVALSQSKLREQVEGLLTRMNSRLVEQDPAFKKIAELLPQAVTAMSAAEGKLRAPDPQAALEPEQKALQILQKAEEEYEVQISMQRGGGGGGGGGQSATAQELADLFEMELDKVANQYETAQRAEQQNTDQKVDELMEKLRELARRQEQEAERQRQRALAGQQGGGSNSNQRALAEQVEEAARRLEQLSREENRSDLAQTARQLRDAADAMRRASANGDPSAAAQASAALERLKEAERRLQQSQSGRAERDVRNARQQAEEIAREQRDVAEAAQALDGMGAQRQERVEQLSQRKEQLATRVGELEQQVNKTAGDIAKQEKEASRKMSEAAGTLRDRAVRDRIRWSRSMMRAGLQPADAAALDKDITSTLDGVRDKLREAEDALGRSAPDAMGQALDKARELARGMESLDQRMRERAQGQQGRGQRGQRGQQGQEGQQGQQGQQGREGQQGQAGQQGQSGQEDQAGPQGQQGQRGQQGQQGQGGQGGENAGQRTADGRGGVGDTYGGWQNGAAWGGGDRRPGNYGPEDIRQFRGEIRQWINDAEQLRRLVQGQRMDARQLEEVLRGLRQLQDDRIYQDVEELQRLQSAVTENMKRFEFGLRRRAEGGNAQPVLSGSDEVPEQFRKLVEQYYKSLSKGPEKK